MKKRSMFAWVTVTGPPSAIWVWKSGTTPSTALPGLARQGRQDRAAAASEDIAKAHRDERTPALLRGILHDPFADPSLCSLA